MNLYRLLVFPTLIFAMSACSTVSKNDSQKLDQAAQDPAVVKTESGLVRGVYRNGSLEFRGIPYAAAPSGDRRWAAPQPAAPWKGIRDASQFGPACPQVARFNLTEGSDNEDCLSVNVSLPEKFDRKSGAKLPVFIWIHGGGFVGGSSSLYRLDQLARDGGIMVVSMNYRLGVFGWMPHPSFDADMNGAYGLEDQRAAMRWVQRNIAAFGGDPNNVTVGGESAGGGSTCHHLASPEAVNGLFHKAIIQSAGCLQPMPKVEEIYPVGLKLGEMVGCSDPKTALQCLRKAPLNKLLDAQTQVAGTTIMAYGPTVGSKTVSRGVGEAVKTGQIMKVPLLMGGTKDEIRLYIAYDHQAGRPVTRENYEKHVRGWFGSTADEQNRKIPEKVLRKYKLKKNDVPAEALGSLVSSYNPNVGINNCLFLHTATSFSQHLPAIYQFEFDDPAAPVLGVGIAAKPDPGFKLGSVHSSELNYLFPNLSNTSKIDAPDLAPASQELANKMVAYWAEFVKSGVPSAASSPAWPKFKGGKTVMLLKPGKVGLYNAGKAHQCDFWKSLYPERL